MTDQLTAAVGLGGRDRLSGSTTERARISVTTAVKAAIRRIAAEDAEHLTPTVRTGTYCTYTAEQPWQVLVP